jgi:hypothetical protein
MAGIKISALPVASTPLAGTEVLPIVQSSATVQVAVSNLTAGLSGTAGININGTVGATTATTGAFTVATLGAGTTSAPSLTTTGDTNTGVWFPAANAIAVSTDAVERMRINATGNVLIGTTTVAPATSGFGVEVDPGGAGVYTRVNIGHSATTGLGESFIRFFFNNAQIGSITQNATTTAYNTSSDYRLKDNIAPMVGALATIAQLKPVTYSWKLNGASGQGFIAHELQDIVPDCVNGVKDAVDADGKPKYQGIDTSFLVATLTAAMQEQQALIVDLTARIAALEA